MECILGAGRNGLAGDSQIKFQRLCRWHAQLLLLAQVSYNDVRNSILRKPYMAADDSL